MEGCAGALGRCYYAEGPVEDVMGRPAYGEVVLARPYEFDRARNEKIRVRGDFELKYFLHRTICAAREPSLELASPRSCETDLSPRY